MKIYRFTKPDKLRMDLTNPRKGPIGFGQSYEVSKGGQQGWNPMVRVWPTLKICHMEGTARAQMLYLQFNGVLGCIREFSHLGGNQVRKAISTKEQKCD